MKKTLTEIESALTEAVFSLTPSPHEPSEDIEKELITFCPNRCQSNIKREKV